MERLSWPHAGTPVLVDDDGAVANRKTPIGGFPWAVEYEVSGDTEIVLLCSTSTAARTIGRLSNTDQAPRAGGYVLAKRSLIAGPLSPAPAARTGEFRPLVAAADVRGWGYRWENIPHFGGLRPHW